jgi:hypothetical protein
MSVPQVAIDPKPIPPELDRWNWGAFLLGWIWGIGNNTYIALLALIPGVNLIMHFVLGFKGNQWAWRNGRWDGVEHFKRVQRAWAKWGLIVWIIVALFFGSLFSGASFLLKNSEAYQLGVSRLQANPVAVNFLGTPITTDAPTGSVSISGSSGEASLTFSASGPKGAGTVFVEAVKKDDVWSITRLALKLDGQDEVIDLIGTKSNST